MEQFKQRYINYLLSQGLDRTEAVRLYDAGTGEFAEGYSPEWQAREQLECSK